MSEKPHSMSCEYPEGCSCGASSWNEREAEIVRLKAELKDAQIAVIISRIQCVYCGTCMDVNSTDTLEHQFENHARSCPEHPMRVVEQERDALKAELETARGLVVEGVAHLEAAGQEQMLLLNWIVEKLTTQEGRPLSVGRDTSAEIVARIRNANKAGEGKS